MGHDFNNYKLAKWSRLVRIRDGFECRMCGQKPERRTLQAHHIYPKSIYQILAYDLDNGIALCVGCHIVVVHGGNTFDTYNWRKFTPMFRYMMRLSKYRRFNDTYQIRLS